VSLTIALDAMGGDHGARITVAAALAFSRQQPDIHLILVGQENILRAELDRHGEDSDHISIHHASQVVAMDEPPALALRKKKDSSMRVAINMVKESKAQACVSAGNTGALMATAHFVLKGLPDIARPALCSTLPTTSGHVHMLDLGANVECSPEQLLQFGVMASIMVTTRENKPQPRVGLLNIGEEDIKGNDVVKKAAVLFRNSKLNYQGYVEGNEIYTGDMDVVVCDGFVGNVALKASEGVAQMIIHVIKEEFRRNMLTRLMGLLAMPVIKAFGRRMDHRIYNGASLLGLNGIVIKSHGGADALGFQYAIAVAAHEAKSRLIERMTEDLNTLLGETAA